MKTSKGLTFLLCTPLLIGGAAMLLAHYDAPVPVQVAHVNDKTVTCHSLDVVTNHYPPGTVGDDGYARLKVFINGAVVKDEQMPVDSDGTNGHDSYHITGLNGFTYRIVITSSDNTGNYDSGTLTQAPCDVATTIAPVTTTTTVTTVVIPETTVVQPSITTTMMTTKFNGVCDAIKAPDTRVCTPSTTKAVILTLSPTK